MANGWSRFSGSSIRRSLFPDRFDQLLKLFALAVAHVEEANTDQVPVIDGLSDAGEADGPPSHIKFDFDTRIDAHGEAFVGADAAAVHAQIEDASLQARWDMDKNDHDRGIELVPGLPPAIAPDGISSRLPCRPG